MPKPKRVDTKAEAQRVALALFTQKGFDATSLREIAEQLGVSKAALYYHFKSKDAIVASLVTHRATEVAALVEWVRNEKPAPDLAERTVLRWVDSASADKLRGIRFMLANPALLRRVGKEARGITDGLKTVAELAAGKHADGKRALLVRMAFLSINSAVMAAAGTQLSDDDIVAAAKEMARAILGRLRA